MTSSRMIAGLVLAIAVSGAASGQERGQAETAVAAADAAWEHAYAAKNLEKSVADCDQNVSLLWPNMPVVRSKADVRAAIAKDFAGGDLAWHSTAVGVARSGDLAYSVGTYQWKLRGGSGKGSFDKGKYLTVWKKQADGSWRVLFDTFNSDLPAGG
jgi:ketosteroid isomerase-like protein